MTDPPTRRHGGWLVLALVALAVAIVLVGHRRPDRSDDERPPADDFEARLRQACSRCHGFPPPEAMPRAAWAENIEKMYEFLGSAGEPIEGLSAEDVTAWYETRAPEFWSLHPAGREGGPLSFEKEGFRPAGAPPTPAISDIRLTSGQPEFGQVAIVCDMRHSLVFNVAFPRADDGTGQPPGFRPIASVPHPCRTELFDLDGDGREEILVADLGSFLPGDHDRGTVSLLRDEGRLPMARHVLADGLGRVSDARPIDMDDDGDLDILVGVFGWHDTGRVLWLENRTPDGPGVDPVFVQRDDLDRRTGVIQTPPADLDGDGKTDFVALFSQEHETLVAFLRRGQGFDRQTLDRAPHPSWGSNGLAVVDLDGDGDLDVVLSNGDTLDDFLYKDYHGLRWIENAGRDAWREHAIARVYGVHGLRVADMDGDGDLDLVAGAFIPQFDPRTDHPDYGLPSLLWFEQTEPGRFEPWVIERRHPYHAALDVGDIDGDGDLDIVAGNFWMEYSGHAWADDADWIEVWRNTGR